MVIQNIESEKDKDHLDIKTTKSSSYGFSGNYKTPFELGVFNATNIKFTLRSRIRMKFDILYTFIPNYPSVTVLDDFNGIINPPTDDDNISTFYKYEITEKI